MDILAVAWKAATMTTTTERGPMETWLSENKNAVFCDGSNVHEDWLDPDEVAAFAREQDARLAACVAAIERLDACIEDFFQWKRTHKTARLAASTLEGWQLHLQEALRRARGETP